MLYTLMVKISHTEARNSNAFSPILSTLDKCMLICYDPI